MKRLILVSLLLTSSAFATLPAGVSKLFSIGFNDTTPASGYNVGYIYRDSASADTTITIQNPDATYKADLSVEDQITGGGILTMGTGPTVITDSAGKVLSAAMNTVGAAQGGTGITSYAVGDILYASGSTTLSKLADVATGSVLVSGGVTTAPAWSSGPTLTGNLTVSGGTATIGGNAVSTPSLILNGAAATVRGYRFQTAGVIRWQFTADSQAETGSDAGSRWTVSAYTDAGAFIDSPIVINRASGGTFTISRPLTLSSTQTINGNGTFGDASTDTYTFTGRIIPRTVTDSGMASTAGSAREALVFNSSDSRWYASIAGGSPATDWGYFLRNTDATQVLKNTAGLTLDMKDSDSTSSVDWIRALGTSGASDTYGSGIRFNGGSIEFYTDPSPTDTSNNLTLRMQIASNGAITYGGASAARATVASFSNDAVTSGFYPGGISLASDGSTTRYLWLTDAGDLRIHTAEPTADTDGDSVAPDGLFGGQVGSTLTTERTTTGAAYSQVTGTGISIPVNIRSSQVIIEYEAYTTEADYGQVKVILSTVGNTSETMATGLEQRAGYFSDAGTMRSMPAWEYSLQNTSYQKFRVHFDCTRMSAGTAYLNVFFKSTAADRTTYIKNIAVYTN